MGGPQLQLRLCRVCELELGCTPVLPSLSGGLPLGVMSAGPGAKLALCSMLATKVHVGLKCSVYKCVVRWPGVIRGITCLTCQLYPVAWEFILRIKELKCWVKSFILTKGRKSYWKENKEIREMQNQRSHLKRNHFEKVFEDPRHPWHTEALTKALNWWDFNLDGVLVPPWSRLLPTLVLVRDFSLSGPWVELRESINLIRKKYYILTFFDL